MKSEISDISSKIGALPTPDLSNGIAQTQAQVNHVTDIMRQNVEKVLYREEALNDLQERSNVLAKNSAIFRRKAKKIQRKHWWQNVKLIGIFVLICIFIVIIIIVSLVCSGYIGG